MRRVLLPLLIPLLWSMLASAVEAKPSKKDAALLAAAERVACGPSGCTHKCLSRRPDHRMRVVTSFLGHFDGLKQQSAIVSMIPCTDQSYEGRERIVVFLQQKVGRWRVIERLEDSLMYLGGCTVHTFRSRDVLLCREAFFSAFEAGDALCSVAWGKELQEECVLGAYSSVWKKFCEPGVAQRAEMGEWQLSPRPDGTFLLRVPVTVRSVEVTPGPPTDEESDGCERGDLALFGTEDGPPANAITTRTYELTFKVTENGLEPSAAETKAIDDVKSYVVLHG